MKGGQDKGVNISKLLAGVCYRRGILVTLLAVSSQVVAHRFCRNGLQLDLRERRGLDLGLGLLGHRLQLRLEVDGRRLEWREERRETSLRIGLKEYSGGWQCHAELKSPLG